MVSVMTNDGDNEDEDDDEYDDDDDDGDDFRCSNSSYLVMASCSHHAC